MSNHALEKVLTNETRSILLPRAIVPEGDEIDAMRMTDSHVLSFSMKEILCTRASQDTL